MNALLCTALFVIGTAFSSFPSPGSAAESPNILFIFSDDLESDPDELTNIYGKDEYHAITEQLRVQLQELREEYGDT